MYCQRCGHLLYQRGEGALPPGVSIDPVSVRAYPQPYAAHLLGRVGLITAENWDTGENYKAQGYSMDDSVGQSGVEYAFESYLKGTPR